MDIREFSNKLAEATKNMSEEERASLIKMFEGVSKEIAKTEAGTTGTTGTIGTTGITEAACEANSGIPTRITERQQKLKDNYMTHIPTITTHRARAVTKITKENPGMPKIMMRAKCFRYCCETAPLVIQDNELIVGAPNGAPRAGAFSRIRVIRRVTSRLRILCACTTP